MTRFLASLLLLGCAAAPCEEWLDTDWRAPAVETCTGVLTERGGAIVLLGIDDLDACPDARSCTMLTPGRDESGTRYVRLADGPLKPTLLEGVDCSANSCDELELSGLGARERTL